MSLSLISDSQKDFIISSIQNNFRSDGRSNSQPQKYNLKINNLDHLLGSCLLSLQSSQNQIHIYTGIKIKVQKTTAKTTTNQNPINLQNIRQRVVLQLGCIKKLTEQQEQTRLYLEEYLNKFIVDNNLPEFQQLLSIPSAKRHHLTINIEAYILSAPHTIFLQHLYLCVKTAIQNIQMPEFVVSFNEVTDQQVVEVNLIERSIASKQQGDQKKIRSIYKGLKAIRLIGVLGQNYIKGMTIQQFEAVDSCILVTFDDQQRVHSFESIKGSLRVDQIHQILKFAKL